MRHDTSRCLVGYLYLLSLNFLSQIISYYSRDKTGGFLTCEVDMELEEVYHKVSEIKLRSKDCESHIAMFPYLCLEF